MRMQALAILGLWLVSVLGVTGERPASQNRLQPDAWDPGRALVGTWEGTSNGRFGPAKLEVTWKFVLDGKFLQSTTKSISDDEVHQDLGMLSYDEALKRFVYRGQSSITSGRM